MKRYTLLYFCCALLSVGCGNDPAPDTTDNDTTSTTTVIPVDPDFDWEDLDLPTPHQMANMLDIEGITFVRESINSRYNLVSYISRTRQAFNFGGYTSDMTFCILTEQNADANDCLRALADLSGDLGLMNVFESGDLLSTFSSSMQSKDSLLNFMESLEDALTDYTASNDLLQTQAMIFCGGWIESMYIGSKQRADISSSTLDSRLIRHMMILDNLLPAIKAIPEKDEFLVGMIAGLDQVQSTFKGFDIIKKVDEMSNDQMSIRREEWDALNEKIDDIRSLMVTP